MIQNSREAEFFYIKGKKSLLKRIIFRDLRGLTRFIIQEVTTVGQSEVLTQTAIRSILGKGKNADARENIK
jgi:hypothetical protein